MLKRNEYNKNMVWEIIEMYSLFIYIHYSLSGKTYRQILHSPQAARLGAKLSYRFEI